MINLAVIDLGSNSVRLRITEINESGNYNLVSYEKNMFVFQKIWGQKNAQASANGSNDKSTAAF